ncbi:MAG: hypothetical protein ACOZF0_15460 [Thermodesulfobacteriota bacterium]
MIWLRKLGIVVLLFGVPAFFACSSDDAEVTGWTTDQQGGITGIWDSEETVSGNCAGEQYPFTIYDTYQVEQSGSSLTVRIQSKSAEVSGTINGNWITWKGSFPADGGTLSIDFSGTLVSENRISGTATWEWAGNGTSCNGTTQITASREEQAGQWDASGWWQGSWASGLFGIKGGFTAAITQQGATLTGTINVPDIGIENEPLKGTASGSSIVFGDVNDRIIFSGELSGTTTAAGTYRYPGILDSGTWNAVRTGSN